MPSTDMLLSHSARESRAAAELELLSATSGEVCEMWSGSQIVRVAGQPSTMQYIINRTVGPETVMTLSEALKQNIYIQSSSPTDTENSNAAPNLTINVQNALSISWQLLTLAAVGVLIQLTAFVISAIIVYDWSWKAGSEMLSSYGFPCYLVGTALLTLGLIGCSRVVQNSSKVDELTPKHSQTGYQPLYIQKACTVDDKHFLSYAILHPEGQPVIKVSRSNGRDYSLMTLCSTVVTLLGYISQFVGLRAMHWSVALIQLAATFLMTCARAFIRQGLANQPICHPLPMGTDATGLAYIFSEINSWELSTLSESEEIDSESNLSSLSYLFKEAAADLNPSRHLIMIARSIGENVPSAYSTDLLAQQLVNAILLIMKIYSKRQADRTLDGKKFDCDEHCWEILPLLRTNDGKVDNEPTKTFLYSSLIPRKPGTSQAVREKSALKADPETFSAILSLWLAVLVRRHYRDGTQDELDRAQQSQYYRIIGNDRVPPCVPQGKTVGKWFFPGTALHTMNLGSNGGQKNNAPIFGVQFSFSRLRFRAVNE